MIDQLSLLCSGFQFVEDIAAASDLSSTTELETAEPSEKANLFQADACLRVNTVGGQGSTCAILTPSIKQKLKEMNSGQILEVLVDDPSAKEDVEAWCRLSGNLLMKIDVDAEKHLHFYLVKK
jgi:TusA-related sulfurtransferase